MSDELKKLFRKMIEDRKNWYGEQAKSCPKVHQVSYQSVSTAYADVLEMYDYLLANDKANLENFDYFGQEN